MEIHTMQCNIIHIMNINIAYTVMVQILTYMWNRDSVILSLSSFIMTISYKYYHKQDCNRKMNTNGHSRDQKSSGEVIPFDRWLS